MEYQVNKPDVFPNLLLHNSSSTPEPTYPAATITRDDLSIICLKASKDVLRNENHKVITQHFFKDEKVTWVIITLPFEGHVLKCKNPKSKATFPGKIDLDAVRYMDTFTL